MVLNFKSNSILWILIGSIGSALFTIVGFRVVGELSGVEGFAGGVLRYGLVLLVGGLLGNPLSQGIGKFYFDKSRKIECDILLITTIYLVIFQVIIISLVLLSIRYFINFESIKIIFICLLALIFESIRPICTSWLQAEEQFLKLALVLLSDALLRPVIAFFLFNIGCKTTELVLLAYTISAFISAGIVSLLILNWKIKFSFNKADANKLIKFSYPLIGNSLFGWLSSAGDRYIIAGVLGTHSSGIYIASTAIGGRVSIMLGNLFETYYRPKIYEAVKQVNKQQILDHVLMWGKYIVISGILIAGSIWIMLPIVENYLMASEFRVGASSIILVSFLANLFAAFCLIPLRLLYAIERTDLVSFMEFFGFSLTMLGVYLGSCLGSLAAASIGVLIAFAFKLIASVYLVKRNFKSVFAHRKFEGM